MADERRKAEDTMNPVDLDNLVIDNRDAGQPTV